MATLRVTVTPGWHKFWSRVTIYAIIIIAFAMMPLMAVVRGVFTGIRMAWHLVVSPDPFVKVRTIEDVE